MKLRILFMAAMAVVISGNVYAEKPYYLTPLPIVGDDIDINSLGKTVIRHQPMATPEDPRPEPLLYEVDSHQIRFNSSINSKQGLQVVDFVPDRVSYSQAPEETVVKFKTDVIVLNNGNLKNARIVMRENDVRTHDLFIDGETKWKKEWSGNTYVFNLNIGGQRIVIQHFFDNQLVNEWKRAVTLKTNTSYEVSVAKDLTAQEILFSVVETRLNDSGLPEQQSVWLSGLSVLGFETGEDLSLPYLFSVGANKSHTVFWNTILTEDMYIPRSPRR